jgi:hypothetical protein
LSRGPTGRRWMGKGQGGDYGGGGGREIKREEGWDGNGEAPCLVLSGGTCSCRGVTALTLAIMAAVTATATTTARSASTDEELAYHQNAAEKDKRDQDNAEERGGQSPRDVQEFGTWGACGGDNDAGI